MGCEVVVTGLGVVTPVGCSLSDFWDSLKAGKQGFSEIPYFDASQYRNASAGVVGNTDRSEELGRSCAYASMALSQALEDSSLRERGGLGIVAASNFGGFLPVLRKLTDEFSITGPALSLSLSCASGAAAIASACDQILLGRAESMIAVGYEEITEAWYSGLSALRAITTDTVRPFDIKRDGTLFGEGSGAVILETAKSALKRGAHIYGKILGYEMNNDAYHMTAPDPRGDGIKRAMKTALSRGGIKAAEVDYVNMHGTGTRYNDRIETTALKEVLGPHAYEVPVVSIKSMISHMMGAAGIVEAISCLLTIRDGIVPPTVGLRNADPECDLDYVAGTSRRADISIALTNSSGIGGANCAVVIGKG